jgi:hypothetical protein
VEGGALTGPMLETGAALAPPPLTPGAWAGPFGPADACAALAADGVGPFIGAVGTADSDGRADALPPSNDGGNAAGFAALVLSEVGSGTAEMAGRGWGG